jgi:hypothetical protein
LFELERPSVCLRVEMPSKSDLSSVLLPYRRRCAQRLQPPQWRDVDNVRVEYKVRYRVSTARNQKEERRGRIIFAHVSLKARHRTRFHQNTSNHTLPYPLWPPAIAIDPKLGKAPIYLRLAFFPNLLNSLTRRAPGIRVLDGGTHRDATTSTGTPRPKHHIHSTTSMLISIPIHSTAPVM